MGAGHAHPRRPRRRPLPDGWSERPWWRRRLTELVLLLVLVPILAATVIGAVVLWPTGSPPLSARLPADVVVTVVDASVVSAREQPCPGTSQDRLPDGSIPAETTCAVADVQVTSGADAGERLTVAVPRPVFRSGIDQGAQVRLAGYRQPDDSTLYAWQDYARGTPLTVLAVGFAALVVLVARLRGLAALLGLGLAALAIDRFTLPALQFGQDPVAVALVTSVGLMTVLLYLAHGVSNRTTTALLGTVFGLALAAGGAQWATQAAHLTGLGSEENYTLSTLTSQADLSGVVLCGIIVASLGVLNDVTVTQACAVWEIAEQSPDPTFRSLFRSGMRVGRDHLASTVYTIVFAYAGTALPTLLLIDIYRAPLGQVLTSSEIAEELARTFVGAGGLILAIPMTTALAAFLVLREPRRVTGRAVAPS